MKKTDTKVILVHLIFEKRSYTFGSISAIFDSPEGLDEKTIGITKNTLLHAGLSDGNPKATSRAIIQQLPLIRCKR